MPFGRRWKHYSKMTMKKTIAIVAVAAILAVFAFFAPRAVRAINYGREVPVLMYHNVLDDEDLSLWQVSAEEFARQMDELKAAGWKTILPDDIWRASRGLCILPRKPIVITFDDGYEGVMKFAEPVLKKHGFKAICYLIVGRIAGEGPERGSFDSGPLLSTNEVADMAARGTVAFGSHSMSHKPIVGRLANEIRESRYALRRLTGVKTHSYCYPHGLYGHDAMYDALRAAKFRTALICEDELYRFGVETNLLAIPRVSVYGGRHDFRIAQASLAGGHADVTVLNEGAAVPVRCLLRERADGRQFISDGPPVRLGQGRRAEGTSARFHWSSLPEDLDASSLEAIVCEQNGLFTYGEPQPLCE